MCCDDYADVYREARRKARKVHSCCACRIDILAGETYVHIASLYDGSWSTFKQCLRCNRMLWGIAEIIGAPVAIDLDCGADPLDPGYAPELEHLAFMTRAEIQQLADG